MSIDKEHIIEEFKLKPFGSKGWMRSNMLVCPNCGQSDEFALKFTDDGGGVLHCLHSRTCNRYRISLRSYLFNIGRSDLVDFEKSINLGEFPSFTNENNGIQESDDIVFELPIKELPIAFKRLNFDDYLDSRNFLPKHYELFGVGETKIDPRFRGYIIFQFFNVRGGCIGWMARSKKSKEWHEENIRKFKDGIGDLVLRYDNSPDTDFGDILGGEIEITENTDSLILVEGIMDKVNVDKELGLLEQEEIKCCFTFGNKVSPNQIKIINKYKNIKNIYLLYDWGSIKQSKESGLNLFEELKGKNINVCEITQVGLDPGGMTANQIIEVLEKSVNAVSFNLCKIDGIIR